MKRNCMILTASVLFGLLLLMTGCASAGPKAPIETRAGDWNAKTAFGELTMTINDTGTAITKIHININCNGISGEAILAPSPWSIDENGAFTVESKTGGIGSTIKGTFQGDARKATGTWEVHGCSGNWEASR